MLGMSKSTTMGRISVRELDSTTWKDFKQLFGRHDGVWGGCWCMFYHVSKGWSRRTAEKNRSDKRKLVHEGRAHGLLLYNDGDPIGWCQYGPREELPKTNKHGISEPADSWRITCFLIQLIRK